MILFVCDQDPKMFKFENEETSVLKTATKFFVHFLFYISDCGENRGSILKITTKCTTTNLIVEKDDLTMLKIPIIEKQVTFTLGDEEIEFKILNDKDGGIAEINIEDVKILIVYGSPNETNFINVFPSKRVMGHRGCGQMNIYETKKLMEEGVKDIFYENTISSFNKAFGKGAEWVELDIQITEDMTPIVFHDFFILENDQKLPIHRMYVQDFNDFFKIDRPEDDLPTTFDKLILRKEKDLGLNIEIKYIPKKYIDLYKLYDVIPVDKYVNKIIEVLKNYNGKLIFSSFEKNVLLYSRLRLPNSKLLLIIEKDPECPTYLEDSIKFCSKASLDGLVMDCESAELLLNTPDLMPLKKDLKFYVYGDDVSKKEPAKRFLDNGIDGIITDDIDAVISLN